MSLLTFIGSLAQNQRLAMANTLLWFAIGVLLAVLGIGASYFTDYFMAGVAASYQKIFEAPYLRDGPKTKFNRQMNLYFHIAAVVIGVLSLIAFLGGVIAVRNALAHLPA